MADKPKLEDLLGPDVFGNQVIITTKPKSTAEFLIEQFSGRAPKDKHKGDTFYVFDPRDGSQLIKTKEVGSENAIPRGDLVSFHVALKPGVHLNRVHTALVALGFTTTDMGTIGPAAYGFRIYVAPPTLGSFFLHIASRPPAGAFIDPGVEEESDPSLGHELFSEAPIAGAKEGDSLKGKVLTPPEEECGGGEK